MVRLTSWSFTLGKVIKRCFILYNTEYDEGGKNNFYLVKMVRKQPSFVKQKSFHLQFRLKRRSGITL